MKRTANNYTKVLPSEKGGLASKQNYLHIVI